MQGRYAVAFFLVIFLLHPQGASAVFYNDSSVIEIGDGEPPVPGVDEGVGDEGDTGGGNESGAGSSAGGGSSSGGSSSGGDSGGSSESSSGSGSGSSGSSGGSDSSAGGGGGSSAPPSDDDLIEALLASGALGGVESSLSGGSASASGEGGSSSGTSGGGSLGGVSVVGGGSLNVTVDGAKVREALREKGELKDLLQFWRKKPGSGDTSAEEYGLIAASTALRDANVEAISFSAAKFEITYRSRGYLLAVIPITFPVRVEVVPSAPMAERARVRLPWYRFFVREFFTARGLEEGIAELIENTAQLNAVPGADLNATFFEAVAAFLKARVGTVGDSVILRGS